jgi:hypothetical protein
LPLASSNSRQKEAACHIHQAAFFADWSINP